MIAAALACAFSGTAQAQTKLLTYEGHWGDALDDVMALTPDLPVTIERYDASLSGVAASGASLIDVETGAANLLCDEGPGQSLSPGLADSLPDTLMPEAIHPCGVGYLVTSLMLATDRDGPDSWAAFFDAATYPGARALPRGARGTLEIALLSDGVAAAQVYSLLATADGKAAALARLDALFEQTQIVFWDTPDDAVSLLRAGAVSAAAMPSVHAAQIVREDVDAREAGDDGDLTFKLSFDAQIYRIQRLVVLPAATSDRETLLGVIKHVLSADAQMMLADRLLAGPVIKDVWQDMPAEFAPLLPTAPVHDISNTGLADDPDFWAVHGEALEGDFAAWLAAHESVKVPVSP